MCTQLPIAIETNIFFINVDEGSLMMKGGHGNQLLLHVCVTVCGE